MNIHNNGAYSFQLDLQADTFTGDICYIGEQAEFSLLKENFVQTMP